MEQSKDMFERGQQRKIRDMTGMMGIAGEVTFESPARTIEELVEIALNKSYTTIVAVGSDKLINRIASLICNTDVVLGIIPLNTSPIIEKIFELEKNKIEPALLALKQRYLKIVDLAYLYPNRYFLTEATMNSKKPIDMSFQIDRFNIKTKVTDLLLQSPATDQSPNEQQINSLNLFITNWENQPSTLSKGWSWLIGKQTIDDYSSIFRARKIIIETSNPIPVYIDGKIVDKTPIMFTVKPKALKIIKSRAKIVEKE